MLSLTYGSRLATAGLHSVNLSGLGRPYLSMMVVMEHCQHRCISADRALRRPSDRSKNPETASMMWLDVELSNFKIPSD